MKHRSIKKHFPLSVKTGLALYLILGITAVLLIPAIISNYIYSEKLKKNALSSAEYMIEQSAQELQRYIASLNNVILFLAGSEEVTHALSSKVVEYDTHDLNNLLFYTQNYILPEIQSIDLLGENGKKFNLELDISSKFATNPTVAWRQDKFIDESWYQHILASNEPTWFPLHESSYTTNAQLPVMDMGVCVRDIFTYRRIGIVHVELTPEALAAKIPTHLEGQDSGAIYLFDSMGNQIAPVDRLPKGQDIYQIISSHFEASPDSIQNFSYEDQTLVYQQLPSGLSIVGVLSTSEIYADQTPVILYTLGIIFAFACLGVFIVNLLSNKVTQPLSRLVDAMKASEKGHFTVLTAKDSDFIEMQEITQGFTHMTGQITQLMQRMQIEQKKLEEEKFRVLQFQINPHFLYNTLDSIIWLCKENQNEDTILMVSSLMKFYRIALSDGRDFITIQEEIQHVTSYLTIQKLRFKGQFSFTISIDPKIETYITNKLILQPIVENALYHGIQSSGQNGHISILGYCMNQEVIFEIGDTGVGIERTRLERLKKRLEDDDDPNEFGIGLFNVHKRIQFLFGKDYGLSLESEVLFGTNIRITLPVIEEVDYAKSFNS